MRMTRILLPLGGKLETTVAVMGAELNGRQIHQRPEATTANLRGVKIVSENCGRYSSRCTYTKYRHTPVATAWGVVLSGGSVLAGRIQSTGYRLIAPRGYSFGADSLGLRMVGPGGVDWHFSASDILQGETGATLAKRIRAKGAALAEQRKAARLAKSCADIREREISSTRVTLADSRRAGNCTEGTLKWVEQRLGVSRTEVLAAAHLFSVSAGRVLASGDARARAAALAAWDRETTVSI